MIAFWIAAALLAASTAALVLIRAARAGGRAEAGPDPSLAVYRRQLDEIDDLADRGLLESADHRSARAEAARRLLTAAAAQPQSTAGVSPKLGRWLALAGALAAPLAALAIYYHVGSPGAEDRPYVKRLAAWRRADPQSLDPLRIAAVLGQLAAERPSDPQPLYYLGRAELAAGQAYAAERALRKAISLAPRRPDLWTALGATLTATAGGDIGDEASNAFRQARALDPTAPDPRYFLARARIAGGDVAGGLADWSALANSLRPTDPRRTALLQEIAEVRTKGALETTAPPAQPAGASPFVQSMVDRLAARLAAQPNDPAGWARLIRAYGVLGEEPQRQAALAKARSLFGGRPGAFAAIEAAAQGPT